MVTGVLADRHPVKLHYFRTYKEPTESRNDKGFYCPNPFNGTWTKCLLQKIQI